VVRAATTGRKAAAEGGEYGGATMWEKRWRSGLTGAEATKHGRAVTASDTTGQERTQAASDSSAVASDRASREQGAVCGGAWRSTRPCRPSATRGARWRQRADERPGVERERLTCGTPRQILFRIKNTPERKWLKTNS
jgi:hypothetical protein